MIMRGKTHVQLDYPRRGPINNVRTLEVDRAAVGDLLCALGYPEIPKRPPLTRNGALFQERNARRK